jgi:hypothetical protein
MGRENIVKPTIGDESNDNGVRIVKFSASKESSCQEHDVPAPKHS